MKEYIFSRPDEADDTVKRDAYYRGELIRCKDCKHNSNVEGNFVNCDIIPQMFGKTSDNNYCSYAEPKVTS